MSTSTNARLSNPVIQKLREWYLQNPTDVAGPGFYMSKDLTDSAQYGTDLLIVEIDQEKPMPYKKHEKGALGKLREQVATDPTHVDPIHQYAHYEPNWHIITREPKETEGLKITFRPPKAEDVDKAWKEIQSRPTTEALKILANLATLTNERTKSGKLTNSSQIFLDRLLYDHGYDFLKKGTVDLHLNTTETALFEKILLGFEKKLPNDERTSWLKKRYLSSFQEHLNPETSSSVPVALLQSLPFASKHAELLDREAIGKSAKWLVNSLDDPTTGPKEALAIARILETVKPPSYFKLSEQISEKLKKKYNPWKPTTDLETIATHDSLRISPAELNAFDALLGREPSIKMVEKVYTESIDQTRCTALSMSADVSKLSQKIRPLVHYLAEHSRETLQKCIKAGNEVLKSKRGDCVQAQNLALLDIIQTTSIGDEIHIDTQKKIARELVKAVKSEEIGHTIFLKQLEKLQTPFQPEVLEEELLHLVKTYPELRDSYIFALENLLAEVPKRSVPQPVRYAKVIQEIDRVPNPSEWAKKRIAQLAFQLQNKSKNRSDKAASRESAKENLLRSGNQRTVVQFSARVIENIKGHPEYSEVSRIFSLVDPIYVSEDLRRNTANHPFKRFNETYVYQGKNYPQPSWENFTTNWDLMAVEHQAAYQIDDSDFRINMIKNNLSRANRRLLASFVDGGQTTLQQLGRKEWDRKKYEFGVSKEDWDYLELGKEKTNPFLHSIPGSNGEHRFRFKSHEELEALGVKSLKKQLKKNYDNPTLGLIAHIESELEEVHDPIKRAARMITLMSGLHIFENGNGREIRTLVAQDLIRAGYPMPVGLPTHDLFLNEEELMLEIRKAVKLGKFWEQMIQKAIQDKVPLEDFFQKRYRGSALEGLSLISPAKFKEKKLYVEWLEKQELPPRWASEFTPALFSQISKSHPGLDGENLGQVSEVQKYVAADRAWQAFKETHKILLDDQKTNSSKVNLSNGDLPCRDFRDSSLPLSKSKELLDTNILEKIK